MIQGLNFDLLCLHRFFLFSFWKEKQNELENDRKDRINSGKQNDVFSRFSKKPKRNGEKLFIVSNELAEEVLR
ncbi:hypothetical protein LEP1GSC062_2368 [Leptospira alexanderi serovar Manhao 3 str. L 60]|uniref:Uncharacterized protein n=1 Tax=Leptospira alexanderi serovar Manhao 3 str. L 60 TaxID=1049759 RepID=V6I3L7_9LEPT|nr:hypothetical protein LEP1GSC062_2368 [Leptospira alexanderi serovar Manhao 3 str. L 60]